MLIDPTNSTRDHENTETQRYKYKYYHRNHIYNTELSNGELFIENK